MDKTPFSAYDFFAYLSSGAVLVATADYVMGTGLLMAKDIGPVLGVLLIIIAYVCGQIVAHFASSILEYVVVGSALKRPHVVLFGEKPHWSALVWCFRNYFHPLPAATQCRVRQQAESRGVPDKGEGLFLHAYALVTANNTLQDRLDGFRNQYGFARNMSFAFLLSAITIIIARRFDFHPVRLRWALLSATAGVSLFYRYLKFFRQYSYELFVRYAELARPDSKKSLRRDKYGNHSLSECESGRLLNH